MKFSTLILSILKKRFITVSLIIFLFFSFVAGLNGKWKILGISWIAFVSMAAAIPWGIHAAQENEPYYLITGYGIASGAMITSAAIFLIPIAIQHNAVYGGLGIALGFITGFAIHILNYGFSRGALQVDPVVFELILHALTAGIIIGIVYLAMPGLSLILGVAIVSHKAPAGYAAARELAANGHSPWLLLLPACAIGLTALPVSLTSIPAYPILNALIFGFATGIFFHVAINFLPGSETGGKSEDRSVLQNGDRHQLDKHRKRAVMSTFAGGLIVFLLWYISH